MHTDIDIQALMELVRQAGKLLYDREGSTHIRKKGRADYVTQVDMAVQGFFGEELPKRWPHIQFMSEEQSNAHLDPNAPMWILDPVDGTCNLIHDLGMSAISLALVEGGQVMLGIVYNPFNGEMFHAIRGQGAFRNGEPIHVSDQQELADSLIAIGTSPYQKQLAETNFALFRRLFEVGADIRRMGTASLDSPPESCWWRRPEVRCGTTRATPSSPPSPATCSPTTAPSAPASLRQSRWSSEDTRHSFLSKA